MDDDDALPVNLAEMKQLLTWRITCPWCGAISLLAENERVFELLEWTSPKPDEKPFNRFQTALVVLLAATVIAAAILSIVRLFKR